MSKSIRVDEETYKQILEILSFLQPLRKDRKVKIKDVITIAVNNLYSTLLYGNKIIRTSIELPTKEYNKLARISELTNLDLNKTISLLGRIMLPFFEDDKIREILLNEKIRDEFIRDLLEYAKDVKNLYFEKLRIKSKRISGVSFEVYEK